MLQLELRKLLPYRTVWVILLLHAALLVLFVSVGGGVVINGQKIGSSLYAFPGLWKNLSYVASYFNLLPGILLIILITDEYQFRTFRQQVINGSSAAELVQGKLLVAVLLSLFAVLAVLATGLFFGLTKAPETAGQATTGLQAVLLYAVQTQGYFALAALLGFLIRKSGPAILVFLLYAWMVEPVLRYPTPDDIDRYFPTKVLSSLTPLPNEEVMATMTGSTGALLPGEAVPFALAYAALFWLLSYLLLRNRDL
ncbi:ABC transporter permease [Hymenobacter sp. BT175]|uniref:ABC transporter permease n=1 Tax=Hymenobacter translucens TaxID=2886507 RepID=UPI001D0EC88C|nr:ABC transporter permease [Hymenobacter translucens]MCC2545005.1 ABC transporter permease [Hymenobacter translucens]